MVSPVFADAGYWFAVTSGSDSLHKRALSLTATLGRRQIVTSQMVLTEFLDGNSAMGEHRRASAARFVRKLQADDSIRIVATSDELFEAGLALYEARRDKEWGLTDCTSFVICEREGIIDALAHDKHFVQAGFNALLRFDE